MKLAIFILFLLFSAPSFGQEWHLNNIDKTQEYAYEYWFQLDNSVNPNSYQLNKKTGNEASTIKLYDENDELMSFGYIKIENLETGSITELDFSIYNEKGNIQLRKGIYNIQTSVVSYNDFKLKFEIENNQFVEFVIKLNLAPQLPPTIYQINSKKKLKKKKILEIMDCVEKSKKDPHTPCSDSSSYFITLHI
jgi:hypothetical protein